MSNEVRYSKDNDQYLNLIYYGTATQLLKDLKEKGYLSEIEFYRIDEKNRCSFYQNISFENSSE